jgi:hypothetical protein
MNKNLALLPLIAISAASFAATPSKPQATPPLRQPLLGWQTWTSSGERTLPDTPLPEGGTNACVAIVSARGAAATATFAIRSSKAIATAELSVEGLDGISSDIHLVKCWYQDGNAWFIMRRAPGDPILVPELLLHDDSLVKTDPEKKANLLRTSAAGEAPQYAPPSADVVVADDATRLLPFPIAANETREFHIALDIPSDAKPGLFHGRIAVKADGGELGHFDLDLRVIDYVLPEGISRFLGSEDTDGTKVISGRSPAPVKANVFEPFASVAVLPPDRVTPESCAFLASYGITPVIPPQNLGDAKKLFGAKTPKTLWLADQPSAAEGPVPDADALAKTAKQALAAGFADTRLFVAPCKDMTAFVSALDAVDGTGAKAWAFADEKIYGEAADVLASPMRNGLPAENDVGIRDRMGGPYGFTEYSDTRQLDRWHAVGIPDYLFVDTDPGIENPGFWRRRLGMECYWLGYDGFILPSLVEKTAPWTDVSSPSMRSRTFLYPTRSGFIPTLAWEGVRDAAIDARYLSAVTVLARKARYLAELDNKINIEGRKALSWVEWLYPKDDSAEAIRLDCIAWIDRLDAVLRKAGK